MGGKPPPYGGDSGGVRDSYGGTQGPALRGGVLFFVLIWERGGKDLSVTAEAVIAPLKRGAFICCLRCRQRGAPGTSRPTVGVVIGGGGKPPPYGGVAPG